MTQHTYFFDFDSTLVTIESLDECILLSFINDPAREDIAAQVDDINARAMEGTMSFHDSLASRLKLAQIHRDIFTGFSKRVLGSLTPEMPELINSLRDKGHEVCIISGGFREYIHPVAEKLGLPFDAVFANDFTFDDEGFVNGFNKDNPLSQSHGKSALIQKLKDEGTLTGPSVFIGDGMTDLETYLDGVVEHFAGFGGNIVRQNVKNQAPHFFTRVSELSTYLHDIPNEA